MSNERHVSMRLPEDLLARVVALRNRLAPDPAVAASLSTSALLRIVLERGVAAVEGKRPRAKRK